MFGLSKNQFAFLFKNFIFGIEDSLVSTVGLLSGVVIADVSKQTIFLTGMILIFVEAFSMGAGSFLAEQSEHEVMTGHNHTSLRTVAGGVVMFASYFAAGFIPLFPYIVWDKAEAFPISIISSLVSLFILGGVSARFSNGKFMRSAIRMLVVGGVAIGLGVLVGWYINTKGVSV